VIIRFLTVIIFALFMMPAYAVDGISLEAGSSFNSDDDTTHMGRIGAEWNWDKKWQLSENWFISGYWEASIGYWRTDGNHGDHEIIDFGFTPVFRLQREAAISNIIPYAEFAIGAHILSDRDITDGDRFSTNFQFGDHIGLGIRFGERSQYDLGYRMQHLSNAGIDHPNPGINFNQLRFQYHF
jgi:hypothetical protein